MPIALYSYVFFRYRINDKENSSNGKRQKIWKKEKKWKEKQHKMEQTQHETAAISKQNT